MSKKVLLPKDIQQARLDEKWTILKQIFDAWASKLTSLSDEVEIYRNLILGESSLEQSINKEVKQSKNCVSNEIFNKAKNYLMHGLLLCNQNKEKYGAISAEFHLLLAKYHFSNNGFDSSLQSIENSKISRENVAELTKRGCILAAEALCIKGKILENLGVENGNMDVSNVIAAYQLSAEFCLWIFTDEFKASSARKGQGSISNRSVPLALFTSFCKPIELELQRGNIHDAIEHCRSFLRIVGTKETTKLRKILTLQLAEVILCGLCEKNYIAPPLQAWHQQDSSKPGGLALKTYQQRSSSLSSSSGRATPKPAHKDYSRSSSSNKDGSFCPKEEFEEALLLLLIYESLLFPSACVRQFIGEKEERQRTIDETDAVYDLLCVALTRRQQHGLFLECLERGIKLAYHQFALWYQYGLALICNRKYKKALMVLKKCHDMQPDNLQVCLYMIKIFINHWHEYKEAINMIEDVIEKAEDPLTKSNFYLAFGLCYSLMASDAQNHDQAKALRKRAIDALENARDMDPHEVEITCQLALNYALSRQVTVAATYVNQALQLDPSHRDSLLLLSLILSAQSRLQESLEILEVAMREFPDDFHLMQLKVALTEECFGGEQALNVCQEMLHLWSEMYAEDTGEAGFTQQNLDGKSAKSSILKRSSLDVRSNDGNASAAKSIKSLSFAEGVKYLNDEDEANSITASVTLERSLSEVASTSISGTKLKAPAAIALLAKIWLITADVYLKMENIEEAACCILEASFIFPVSPEVLCTRGRLNYTQMNANEAKACFDSALAVTPKNVEAMENLAILHHKSGSNIMAQKYTRDAISVDPSKPTLWHILGVLMTEAGEDQEAANCFFTSLDLDATHPILPFTTVPRRFKNGDT